MYNNQDALGFVETCGLAAAIEVADAMAKTADVTIEAAHKVDAGLVCVICSGDVASCKAAVDAGVGVAVRMGCLAGSNVIARPADEEYGGGLLTPLAAVNAKKAAKKAAKLASAAQKITQNTNTATKQAASYASTAENNTSTASIANPVPKTPPSVQPKPHTRPATPPNSADSRVEKADKAEKPKKAGNKSKKK